MVNLEVSFRSYREFKVFARSGSPGPANGPLITETDYEHENVFLELVVAADLGDATTEDIVAAVIQSFSLPEDVRRWTPVLLTEEQVSILGLNLQFEKTSSQDLGPALPFGLMDNAAHFYDFLMNAPTPFVMLSGPEHIFTFINPAYVQLLGRTSADQLLGLPVREALPDPGFDVCLAVCHKAYETGIPQVRRELLNSFLQEDTGLMVEAYFDIVYHPVRDPGGKVVGIMAQANDVTERVLSRQVSENREQKLYRLWVELENIYAAVPAGIAVVDATDFRLLRLNARQAEFWGEPAEDLLNKSLGESDKVPAELLELLNHAAHGEKFQDVHVSFGANSHETSWTVSILPSLDPGGHVETLTLITQAGVAAGEPYQELQSAGAGER